MSLIEMRKVDIVDHDDGRRQKLCNRWISARDADRPPLDSFPTELELMTVEVHPYPAIKYPANVVFNQGSTLYLHPHGFLSS